MIAALKRNVRSQESTKEGAVPGETGKDCKEGCILTLVSKKKKVRISQVENERNAF